MDLSWILDIKKPDNPRMLFLDDIGTNTRQITITLDLGRDTEQCYSEGVYIAVSDSVANNDEGATINYSLYYSTAAQHSR